MKEGKKKARAVRECDSTTLNRECIYSSHPGDFYVVLGSKYRSPCMGASLANKTQQKKITSRIVRVGYVTVLIAKMIS